MGKLRYGSASQRDKDRFSQYLAEDEELILVTGYGANYLRHRFIYYIAFPGSIFLPAAIGLTYYRGENIGYGMLIGLFLAMAVAFIKAYWLNVAHRYLLTTRRVIIKNGFFAVKLTSALYDKITHIEVEQGLVDRMIMKHGRIIINTAGMNKGEIKLDFVDSPIEFKNLLERLINREREQFGKQTGPVVALEGELIGEE